MKRTVPKPAILDGELLTVQQAAAAVNVKASLIYRRMAEGALPHYRFGAKTFRIARHDLEAWAGQRKEP